MKKIITTIAVFLGILALGFMFAYSSLPQLFTPSKATGYVVSVKSFTGEDGTVFGIDIDNDGFPDLEARTNEILGQDIIKQSCKWHDEKSETPGFVEMKAFTPVKVSVLRCTISNGETFKEKYVPRYIIMNYGESLEKKEGETQKM